MVGPYALGVDIGGSSTKAAVFSMDGTCHGASSAPNMPHQPAPGVAEYSPSRLLEAVERAIREAVEAACVHPSDVVAVTTDAMISGTVGLDAAGRPTTAYTTTLDTRFSGALDAMVAAHGPRIKALVGSEAPVVAAKVAWYRDSNPEAFRRTRTFVTAGGLAGMHLAGLGAEEAFVDKTVLWAVGLSDTRAGVWSSELASLLAVPLSVMPRIVPSTAVVGGLEPGVANRIGLMAGTPVVAGCGDQMAGFLGAGLFDRGRVADSAGTYSVVGHAVDRFGGKPGKWLDVVPSPLGHGYLEQSVVTIGGGFTRQWLVAILAGAVGRDEPLDLDALASAAPVGSDGLIFIPHLGGQGSPSRPSLRGGWLGLGWEHNASHLARSMVEAMAYEVAIATSAMVDREESARIHGYGGGTRSALSNQTKADVTGLPYHSLGDIAPAARAAALLGALATGHVDDIREPLRRAARVVHIFRPDPRSHEIYAERRRAYEAVVDHVALHALGRVGKLDRGWFG